jgi:hypothetical protein
MKKKLLLPLAAGALIASGTQAQGVIEATAGININETQALKNASIEFGGWLNGGVTYASHSNDSGNNGAIPFGTDRVNEFQLNQAYLYLEKAVDTKGSSWDIGGRVDFLFGTDAPSTQASGWDNQILRSGVNGYGPNVRDFNQYDLAFPQAYVEIFAPLGNGLTVKAGHFYTIIGYEVVTSPDNFFYSHAYTMNYGEPFTHSGVLASYQVNDNWSVTGGAVTGWDNFRQDGGDWSFLGGVNWGSDDGRSALAVSLITGENGNDSVGQNTTMYSIVFSHDFSDNLHYVFQHDFGFMEGVAGTSNPRDTDWYGINQYLTYDINDSLSAGLRAEWFSDQANKVNSNFDANYYAISAGVNYSPVSWLKFRPEVRYDWADTNGAGTAFGGNKNDQIQVAADFIITF